MTSSLRITPLTGVIGAELDGVELAKPLTPGQAQDLRATLAEYQVLVFRNQPITPMQQYEFASSLGVVDKPLVEPGGAPAPGITIIQSALAKGLTDEWHTDQPYVKVPPMAAMLHAVTLPSRGGDTCWCNMAAAYDALSQPMKDMLDGLTAVSNTVRMKQRIAEEGKSFGYLMEDEDIIHPLVRVHPETGRKALYVCQLYTARIVEMKEAESRALLQFLYEHSTSVDFMLRLRWTPDTTVIWDERSTIHYAVGDYDEPRLMHRLILKGSAPVGVNNRAMAA